MSSDKLKQFLFPGSGHNVTTDGGGNVEAGENHPVELDELDPIELLETPFQAVKTKEDQHNFRRTDNWQQLLLQLKDVPYPDMVSQQGQCMVLRLNKPNSSETDVTEVHYSVSWEDRASSEELDELREWVETEVEGKLDRKGPGDFPSVIDWSETGESLVISNAYLQDTQLELRPNGITVDWEQSGFILNPGGLTLTGERKSLPIIGGTLQYATNVEAEVPKDLVTKGYVDAADTALKASIDSLDQSKADKSTSISVGEGLTGGGNLSANREIALSPSALSSLSKADTSVQPADLDPYALQADVDNSLTSKVDKVAGKGLSSEDFTAAEKTKLSGIATGATANATNAQLRDRTTHTGEQPISTVTGLQTALDSLESSKVDKVEGKVLSDNNFTTAEKSKLAGLEGSRFKGLFTTVQELKDAIPSASAGDYADVDGGAGHDVSRWIWDVSDAEWVEQVSPPSPITEAQVKQLYESNPDTNAFTDAEKSKLAGIAAEATKNATDAQLRDRDTHTGTQEISTVSGLQVALDSKVDAEAGKGLSTEDYTSEEKSKLSNIEAGAQVNTVTSVAGKTGAVNISKADVGLGSVDNTSDLAKPVSTATQTALNTKVDKEDGKGLSEANYTEQEKSKLAGIAAGATVNASNAQLRDRATHTGTQEISTVEGLQEELDTKVSKHGLAEAELMFDWDPTGQSVSIYSDLVPGFVTSFGLPGFIHQTQPGRSVKLEAGGLVFEASSNSLPVRGGTLRYANLPMTLTQAGDLTHKSYVDNAIQNAISPLADRSWQDKTATRSIRSTAEEVEQVEVEVFLELTIPTTREYAELLVKDEDSNEIVIDKAFPQGPNRTVILRGRIPAGNQYNIGLGSGTGDPTIVRWSELRPKSE